jgi:hypothetical protein
MQKEGEQRYRAGTDRELASFRMDRWEPPLDGRRDRVVGLFQGGHRRSLERDPQAHNATVARTGHAS